MFSVVESDRIKDEDIVYCIHWSLKDEDGEFDYDRTLDNDTIDIANMLLSISLGESVTINDRAEELLWKDGISVSGNISLEYDLVEVFYLSLPKSIGQRIEQMLVNAVRSKLLGIGRYAGGSLFDYYAYPTPE